MVGGSCVFDGGFSNLMVYVDGIRSMNETEIRRGIALIGR